MTVLGRCLQFLVFCVSLVLWALVALLYYKARPLFTDEPCTTMTGIVAYMAGFCVALVFGVTGFAWVEKISWRIR